MATASKVAGFYCRFQRARLIAASRAEAAGDMSQAVRAALALRRRLDRWRTPGRS